MKETKPGLVIVTGGSRGIGAAVAELAALRGHPVLINYADQAAAADSVARRIEARGGEAGTVRADLGDEDGVLQLFAAADRMGAPLTGLVNNAEVTGDLSHLDQLRAEVLTRVLAVNVAGCFLCAREAVLRMSNRHGGAGGSIVNVSSLAAKLGGAGEWIHYAASKGAIDTLTIGLAREVAVEGIRVNAVAPGLIATDIHAAAGVPDRLERLEPGVPMGRAGSAQEVAEAVVWLLSPAASYITGAILPVGGGR